MCSWLRSLTSVTALPPVKWSQPPGYNQMRIHVKHPAQFLPHSKPWIFTDISLIFNIIIHSPSAAPPSSLPTSPLLLSPTVKPVFRGSPRCHASARLGATPGKAEVLLGEKIKSVQLLGLFTGHNSVINTRHISLFSLFKELPSNRTRVSTQVTSLILSLTHSFTIKNSFTHYPAV